MTSKVGYSINSIEKHVSIDYIEEEDLIECYSDKLLEISELYGKKIGLVEAIYPEVFEAYGVKYIRPFNQRLSLVTIPSGKVKELADFYKALDMKYVVSY